MNILASKDTIKNSKYMDYTGQFVVRNIESLSENYQDARWQLFYATSGFGCSPENTGSGVYGYFCGDGEYTRTERFDILGIVKPEVLEQWKKEYGEPEIWR